MWMQKEMQHQINQILEKGLKEPSETIQAELQGQSRLLSDSNIHHIFNHKGID